MLYLNVLFHFWPTECRLKPIAKIYSDVYSDAISPCTFWISLGALNSVKSAIAIAKLSSQLWSHICRAIKASCTSTFARSNFDSILINISFACKQNSFALGRSPIFRCVSASPYMALPSSCLCLISRVNFKVVLYISRDWSNLLFSMHINPRYSEVIPLEVSDINNRPVGK